MTEVLMSILAQCYGAGTDCSQFTSNLVVLTIFAIGLVVLVLWGVASLTRPRRRSEISGRDCPMCGSFNADRRDRCWNCDRPLTTNEPAEAPPARKPGR